MKIKSTVAVETRKKKFWEYVITFYKELFRELAQKFNIFFLWLKQLFCDYKAGPRGKIFGVLYGGHIWRIKSEGKAKVVAGGWGTCLNAIVCEPVDHSFFQSIHDAKQQRRPLPSILSLSFFYGGAFGRLKGFKKFKIALRLYNCI